jgi:hypothetical protein
MRNITLLGIAGASTVAIATWMAATMLIVLPRKAAATPVRAADGSALRTTAKVPGKRQRLPDKMRAQSG